MIMWLLKNITPYMILYVLIHYHIACRFPVGQIKKDAEPDVTGTPEIADNLFTGTDTINLSVNNEI